MSNSQFKEIKLSSDLLSVNPRNIKNKTLKRYKPNKDIQPNKLKKDLLNKIKHYKKNKEHNNNNNNNNDNNDNNDNNIHTDITNKTQPTISINTSKLENNINKHGSKNNILNQDDDYISSITYLQKLSTDKSKNKLNTMNNNLDTTYLDTTYLDTTYLEENDKPKYGCLKNGILPTYKEWKQKTLKNDSIKINPEIYPSNNKNPKTKTLKYYLGKRGRKVSILVKNSETRKNISNEHNILKHENIHSMKSYLKKHNLLKSGTHAPPDIIKKMYEQSLLSGDIRNSNKNNIIHNYLAE